MVRLQEVLVGKPCVCVCGGGEEVEGGRFKGMEEGRQWHEYTTTACRIAWKNETEGEQKNIGCKRKKEKKTASKCEAQKTTARRISEKNEVG